MAGNPYNTSNLSFLERIDNDVTQRLFETSSSSDVTDDAEQRLPHGRALFFFSATNPVRKFAFRVIHAQAVEYFILFCIGLNVVVLALNSPVLPRDSQMVVVLLYFDWFVAVVFTIEAILRILALGAFTNRDMCCSPPEEQETVLDLGGHDHSHVILSHLDGEYEDLHVSTDNDTEESSTKNDEKEEDAPRAYFQDSWSCLDFLVVVTFWLGRSPFFETNYNIGSVRALRALRPLRALKFFSGIRTILESLSASTRLLLNVLLFLVFFFVIYGITGVQLFGGHFRRRCVIVEDGAEVVTDPEMFCSLGSAFRCPDNMICSAAVGNPYFGFVSFDNIASASLTIFTVVSLEGWIDLTYATMDGLHVATWVYYVTLIIFVSFLVLNLFVAVITASFAMVRQREKRSAFSAEKLKTSMWGTMLVPQKGPGNAAEWTLQDMNASAPYSNKVLRWISWLVLTRGFDLVVIFAIVVNTIFLAMEHHQMSETFANMLFIAEVFFTVFFACECALKIVGLSGLRNYFRDPMNRFDLLIVLATILSLFKFVSNSSTLRVFRLLRITRLYRKYPELNKLLQTILGSLVAIANVLFFIAFSLLIFSILGMQLYSGKFDFEGEVKPRTHFDYFSDAMLAMFQVLTGENWTDVFFNGMRSKEGWTAPLFFVGYYLFASYVLLNLFVAVILENFELADIEKKRKQLQNYLQSLRIQPAKHTANSLNLYRLLPDNPRMLRVKALAPEVQPQIPMATIDAFVKNENVLAAQPPPNRRREVPPESSYPAIVSARSRVTQHSHGGYSDRSDAAWWSTSSDEGPALATSYHGSGGAPGGGSSSERGPTGGSAHRSAKSVGLSVSGFSTGQYQKGPRRRSKTASTKDTSRTLQMLQRNLELQAKGGGVKRSQSFNNSRRASLTMIHTSDATSQALMFSELTEPSCQQCGQTGHTSAACPSAVEHHSQTTDDDDVFSDISVLSSSYDLSHTEKDFRITHPTYDRALCCLLPRNKFRLFCKRVTRDTRFDLVILVFIILSSVLLAVENPEVSRDATWRQVFFVSDIIFFVIFSGEFIMKISAEGFIFAPRAYLKDSWNRIDLFVLCITVMNFLKVLPLGGFARVLRVGRTMRPLRIINHNPQMKVIINSLIKSLPAIFNVAILSSSFFVVFGIIGVNLFKGKFYFCNDSSENIHFKADCAGVFVNDRSVLVPRVWANPSYSFDNIFAATLNLFEVASLEGWLDVMYSTMDMTDVDEQPKFENSPYYAWYFVIFIFVGSFFNLNLFVGVIVDNFNRTRNTALLTFEQQRWVDTLRAIKLVHPPVPAPVSDDVWGGQARLAIWRFCSSGYFESFIMSVIIINVIIMTTGHYNPSSEYEDFREIANIVFVAIFTIEMCLKLVGYGPFNYVKSGWNVFDGLLTLGSLVFLIVGDQSVAVGFARAFRIGRIFRIIRRAETLETLFRTLLTSVPSVLNVASLFFLLMFVYAVMGVQLFGLTRHGWFLDRHANFSTFSSALLLLFRMCTGENWQGVQHDCMLVEPFCTPHGADGLSDCGSSWAWMYFVTWYLFGSYVMLNLFIAVILENFGYCSNTESSSMVSGKDLEIYKDLFAKLDSQQAGYLAIGTPDLGRLRTFLFALGLQSPLGLDADKDQWLFRKIHHEAMRQTEVPGQISFSLLLHIIVRARVDSKALTFAKRVEFDRRDQVVDHAVASHYIAMFAYKALAKARERKKREAARMDDIVWEEKEMKMEDGMPMDGLDDSMDDAVDGLLEDGMRWDESDTDGNVNESLLRKQRRALEVAIYDPSFSLVDALDTSLTVSHNFDEMLTCVSESQLVQSGWTAQFDAIPDGYITDESRMTDSCSDSLPLVP